MKVAIMQPYIFPYAGYFQLIKAVDKFIFYDDVNFIKKGWINRNQILINNQAHLISIPLQKASQNILIKDTLISYDSPWRNKLTTKIEMNYKKAPHFKAAFPIVKNIIEAQEKTISDLAILGIKKIAYYLELDTKFELSSEMYQESKELKKENRLIQICKKNNADKYINPSGGEELYSKKDFYNKGMELQFIENSILPYQQFSFNSFISHLSIIDVLMFNSKEQITEMLQQYKLH